MTRKKTKPLSVERVAKLRRRLILRAAEIVIEANRAALRELARH